MKHDYQIYFSRLPCFNLMNKESVSDWVPKASVWEFGGGLANMRRVADWGHYPTSHQRCLYLHGYFWIYKFYRPFLLLQTCSTQMPASFLSVQLSSFFRRWTALASRFWSQTWCLDWVHKWWWHFVSTPRTPFSSSSKSLSLHFPCTCVPSS